MSLTEITAVVFSLSCVWLAVKKHVLNWPIGIVGVCAYMILFYREKLYADMFLQLVFIVQGIYGWMNWLKRKGNEEEIKVIYLVNKQRVLYGILIIFISAIWSYALMTYTNASMPYVDAFAATISLAANWLMAKKNIENWVLWIFADLIYIPLFLYKDLYLSSGIYLIFLILSIKGLIDWSRQSNLKKVLY